MLKALKSGQGIYAYFIGRFMILVTRNWTVLSSKFQFGKISSRIYNRQPARVVPEIGDGRTRPKNGIVDQHYNGKETPFLPPLGDEKLIGV
jgi:hypothetical protein